MLLCICKGISETQARQIVDRGECSLKKLRCQTGLGTQCGICRKPARQLVHQIKLSKLHRPLHSHQQIAVFE